MVVCRPASAPACHRETAWGWEVRRQSAGWLAEHEEYRDIVREHLEGTHTAYQRLYDTTLSSGTQEAYENKEKIIS